MLKYIRRRPGLRLLPPKSIQIQNQNQAHLTRIPSDGGTGTSGTDDDDDSDRCLTLELNLEATKVENVGLKEESNNLREKLNEAEKDIKDKELKIDGLEGQVENRENEIEALRKELYLEKGKYVVQQRGLNEMKGFVKKLYSVAGVVLEGLGGNVPPFHGIEEGDNNSQLETFCSDLQFKFAEWQGNHQLMHNELERTLKIVEDLVEQVDDVKPVIEDDGEEEVITVGNGNAEVVDLEEDEPMSSSEPPAAIPSTSAAAKPNRNPNLVKELDTSLELTRRNPLRRCRIDVNSYDENTACWEHLTEYTQFACEHCGDAFCRLAHVSSQLVRMRNKQMPLEEAPQQRLAPKVRFGTGASESGAARPRSRSRPRPRSSKKTSKRKYRSRSESAKGSSRSRAKRFKPPISVEEVDLDEIEEPKPPSRTRNYSSKDPSQPRVKPQIVVVDSFGVEHKFAGYYNTILPQEQIKSLLDGSPPTKKRRYFCKCGKNYAGFNGLYYHLKFMGACTFQCEVCNQGFKIRPALRAHLRNDHKIEYAPGKFTCVDCNKTFVGTMKEVVAHRKIFHNNNNEDEDDYLSD